MTRKRWLLAVMIFLLASCSAKYSVPPPKMNTFIVLIERDYDTVWSALIDHLSQSSFAIENFEKASGLIVISFSGSPDTFVDCGDWERGSFQGSYIQWLANIGSVSLSGKMNVSVYKMEETVTRVRVNARYILTARSTDLLSGAVISDTWTFDSGSSASVRVSGAVVGIDNTRTCRPTYKLESDILKAVKEFTEHSSGLP